MQAFRSQEDAIAALRAMPFTARRALMTAESDEQLIDVLAVLNDTTAQLGEIKRRSISEIDTDAGPKRNVAEGNEYQMKAGRKAVRSYNTTSLLLDLSDAMKVSMLEALQILVDEGVLRMSWQWMKLKAYAYELETELRIAPREIEDGDPTFHVGEAWTTTSASFTVKE